MLTKVTAYSQWTNIESLILNVINQPESDLFEVRDIQGLGPVKADVNTTPMGSIKGSAFSSTNVGERNIVFTLGLNPDWDEWTVSRLRRLLDKYFMPEQSIRLVFETMEFSPVEILGYIESNDPNMFNKDPEQQISIICPKPDFKSVDPIVISGQTTDVPIDIEYEGTVETGIVVGISKSAGPDPTYVGVRVDTTDETRSIQSAPGVDPPIDDTKSVVMSSVPGEKYIKSFDMVGPSETNLLNGAEIITKWPTIDTGALNFRVYSDDGVQDWTLTYHELFGGL